ncbi:MAG: amidohydrolase [Planctomycetota bacterium]|jgi:predicted amidohydrolase YtcJ
MNRADLVVLGDVLTADPSNPRAGGVASRGGEVVAVGGRDDVAALAAPDATVLDVGAGSVVPGVRDAHRHLLPLGRSFARLDLHGLALDAVRAALNDRASTGDGWIEGAGWNLESLSLGRMPAAIDLAGAGGERPVLLVAHDFHSAVVNEAGLSLLSVDDWDGEDVERDDSGRPTGLLREGAVFRVVGQLQDDAGPGEDRSALLSAFRELLAHGITAVDDMDGGSTLRALASLRRKGGLPLRVRCALRSGDLDTFEHTGLRPEMDDDGLRIHGLKLFLDGALGSRTAWMLDPYDDDPSSTGQCTMGADEFTDLAARAAALGLPCLVHAIGDAATRAALDELARHPGLGHRIEHAQCVHPDDMTRLAALGIAASMQPAHMHTDIPVATRAWGDRGARSFPVRSLLDAGTEVLLGSDAPIEPPHPLRWVHAATERRTGEGEPEGGWWPAQAISREEALRCAAAGPLSPGAPADLVAYGENLLEVPAARLLELRPAHVRLGGAPPEALLARTGQGLSTR